MRVQSKAVKTSKMLARKILASQCSNEVFKRGVKYFEQGRVEKIHVSEFRNVRSSIEGTRKYEVNLTLGESLSQPLVNYYCTCPHNLRDCCKHIVATLVAFLERLVGEEVRSSLGTDDQFYSDKLAKDDLPSSEKAESSSRSALMSYAFASFSRREGNSGEQRRLSLQALGANFFKRFEELQRLALYSRVNRRIDDPKNEIESEAINSASQIGVVSIRTVKNWVGEGAYRLGLQYFIEERLKDRKISRNVLSANVVKKLGSDERYATRIEFKQTKTKDDRGDERKNSEAPYHHVSAWCECLEEEIGIKKRKSVCSHITAVLISWAMKPDSFERTISENNENFVTIEREKLHNLADIAKATDQLFVTLETMMSLILEEDKCTETEVLDLIQLLYSKMRVAVNQVGERWEEEIISYAKDKEKELEIILGFSFLVNVINSRIFSVLDVKYKSGMMKIRNDAEIQALRKIVENFVEIVPRNSKALQEQKLKEPLSLSIPLSLNKQGDHKGSKTNTKENKKRGTQEENHEYISRSWDKIVEEFVSG